MAYRQQVHIKLDNEDYIYLKNNNINISELTRNLIKSYIDNKYKNTDLDKLKKEKRKKEETIEQLKHNLATLNIQIFNKEEEEKKRLKKDRDEVEKKAQAFVDSGAFQDMVDKR